ncbi:MAG: hypothetical protein R3E21_01920 [Caenibius sp.]
MAIRLATPSTMAASMTCPFPHWPASIYAASGVNYNIMLYLSDRGISRANAASIVGLYGLFTVAGRFAMGFILDRQPFHIGIVMGMVLATASIAFLIIGLNQNIVVIIIGLCIYEFVLGAEVDCLSFSINKLFGELSFGAIYGVIGLTIFYIGVGFGGPSFSMLADHIFPYEGVFIIWSAIAAISNFSLFCTMRLKYYRG